MSTGPSGWFDQPASTSATPPSGGPGLSLSHRSQNSEDNGTATLAHVLAIFFPILGPLVIYLVGRDRAFVRYHGAEALNFSLTLMVGFIASFVLMFVLVGFLTFFVVAIGGLVLHIVAAVHASRGEYYRYPINIRLVPSS